MDASWTNAKVVGCEFVVSGCHTPTVLDLLLKNRSDRCFGHAMSDQYYKPPPYYASYIAYIDEAGDPGRLSACALSIIRRQRMASCWRHSSKRRMNSSLSNGFGSTLDAIGAQRKRNSWASAICMVGRSLPGATTTRSFKPSVEQHGSSDQLNCSEEAKSLSYPRCDGAKVLEFVEELNENNSSR